MASRVATVSVLVGVALLCGAASAQTAQGACSGALNKCKADVKCAKTLACYDYCRFNATPPAFKNPLHCVVGCNAQGALSVTLFKSYLSCLTM